MKKLRLIALILITGFLSTLGLHGDSNGLDHEVPPSWKILPIPRFVDYGVRDELLLLGKVAIVRNEKGPYHTIRDDKTELVGDSTITEEELTRILAGLGVSVESVADDRAPYDEFDTVILLGSPSHNQQTKAAFAAMQLSFDAWDDPRTDEDDFKDWPDLGTEGYILKVGRVAKQNVAILAGHDFDDSTKKFHGAGTFYALQSFRQLVVTEEGAPTVKTAEIADSPLVPFRGCYTGYSMDERQSWRDAAFIPRVKANVNVFWYGNQVVTYNAEAASKFRYPWRPDQMAFLSALGKYCRERYVSMMFCMNPDHYNRDWAAPKAFDGKTKDPLHYAPNHKVEPEFVKMWADLGYEVESDIEVLAAKFSQLASAVPGAMLQIMNEDDVFGLVHEADKNFYGADTGDAIKDMEAYGRARAEVVTALYKRVRKAVPESSLYMPVCPPSSIPYQLVLERNELHSREFMAAMTGKLEENGLLQYMPMLTTGGGTAPEVTTDKDMSDFKGWCLGAPVMLSYNNFTDGYHVGAYEMDPGGERSYLQINAELPAGFRSREIYKHIWGFAWNGLTDEQLLAWTQGHYMWNMLAGDREDLNQMAARKITSRESYPIVKSLVEEFDNPASYLPDNQPPYRIKAVSDRLAFPSGGKGPIPAWVYDFQYTNAMRLEGQRLRDKLARLVPLVEKHWNSTFQKRALLESYAHNAAAFCSVYLTNGYVLGWKDRTATDLLEGDALRDLYLEAADIQERFFAGPRGVPGRTYVDRDRWVGHLKFLYTGGLFKTPAATIEETEHHVDIWTEGLLKQFFQPVSRIMPAALDDDDPRLVTGWGKVEGSDKEKYRSAYRVQYPLGRICRPALDVRAPAGTRLLVRARLGTAETDLTKGTPITLSTTSETMHDDVICKPRWIYWLLPEATSLHGLWLHADTSVRVYAVEVYRQKE